MEILLQNLEAAARLLEGKVKPCFLTAKNFRPQRYSGIGVNAQWTT